MDPVGGTKVEDDLSLMLVERGGVKAEIIVDEHKSMLVDSVVQQPKQKSVGAGKRKQKLSPEGGIAGGYDESGILHASSIVMGDRVVVRCPPVAHMASVVTWFLPRVMVGMAPSKPRKKPRHDNRVSNPGKGSRGSDKRTPRNLTFKLQVIEHHSSNLSLKKEAKLEDPCLATARQFGINKSQVSKWYAKREQIIEKMNSSSTLGGAVERVKPPR